MKMTNVNVYRVLYSLLHVLFTALEYIYGCLIILIKKLQILCHELEPVSRRNKRLHNKLIKLSKKPKHLTVLLGAEEVSLKDLANVIIWSLTTQISFISFYDYKGKLL